MLDVFGVYFLVILSQMLSLVIRRLGHLVWLLKLQR